MNINFNNLESNITNPAEIQFLESINQRNLQTFITLFPSVIGDRFDIDGIVLLCVSKQSFNIIRWLIESNHFTLKSEQYMHWLLTTRNWPNKEAFKYFYCNMPKDNLDAYFKEYSSFKNYTIMFYFLDEHEFLLDTKFFRQKLFDDNFLDQYCIHNSHKTRIKEYKQKIELFAAYTTKLLKNKLPDDIIKYCICSYF